MYLLRHFGQFCVSKASVCISNQKTIWIWYCDNTVVKNVLTCQDRIDPHPVSIRYVSIKRMLRSSFLGDLWFLVRVYKMRGEQMSKQILSTAPGVVTSQSVLWTTSSSIEIRSGFSPWLGNPLSHHLVLSCVWLVPLISVKQTWFLPYR